jgi:hypothetical protein
MQVQKSCAQKHHIKSHALNIGEIETWGQFRQHSMRSFCANRLVLILLAHRVERHP